MNDASSAPGPRGALVPGELFAGELEIVRPLASGGMGAVYVVLQRTTGRRRALKLLKPELAFDARVRERFHHEARVGARVQSEHVVEVVDAGVEASTGTPWILMELLDGEDLATWLPSRVPVPWSALREIIQQLCHALAAAHAAGVVHRDLKPENVFIARTKRSDVAQTVKVLDFGIAKWLDDARTSGSGTQSIGTPLWMAPEQSDAGERIDASTDVWALGLVVFWMLTGRYYWKQANAEDASLRAVIFEMIGMPLDPASERARDLGASAPLPSGFDAWFARCVVRERERRWKNAADAYAALATVLEVDPLGATLPRTPGTPTPRAHDAMAHAPTVAAEDDAIELPGMGRPRAGVIAAGALAVVLGVAGVSAFFVGGQTSEPAPRPPAVDVAAIGPAPAHVAPVAPAPSHVAPLETAASVSPASVEPASAASVVEPPERDRRAPRAVRPREPARTEPPPPDPDPEPAPAPPVAAAATSRALVIANERPGSVRVELDCDGVRLVSDVPARGEARVEIPAATSCRATCSDGAGLVPCNRVTATATRLRVR